jgi:nucleotide-binding universal stress UspA family protein
VEAREGDSGVNQDLDRRYLVVGVHDSAASYAALQWAAREAKLRETSLLVVRAWEDQAAAPYAPCARRRVGEEEGLAAATRLEQAVETTLGPASEIPVKVEVTRGLAARVLLDRAVDAGLLVLGCAASSSSGPVGPVARACLPHTPCPVVLVSQEQMGVPA